MSDKTYLGSRLRSFDTAPEFDSYTKVIIQVDDDLFYEAGTETGRTLTLACPWGTQKMAEDLVARMKGFQYQPYTARGAQVDPAAELGDGITVSGVYSGIYSRRTKFGRLHSSEVAAPTEEEIDHEYPYVPRQQRKVERKMGQMSAQLLVHAQQILMEVQAREESDREFRAAFDVQAVKIAAKVEKSGGDASSFGWDLLDDSWTVLANNIKVFQVTKNGADVVGKITATSGKIGGFDILANYLSYNGQTWGGTNTTGGYFGTSGLQLGKNFKVDMQGNLWANSGTFAGNVYAGNIQYGGSYGRFNGEGLSSGSVYGGSGGKISGGSISTFNTSGGINTSLGHGDYAYDVAKGYQSFGSMIGSYMSAKSISLGGHSLGRKEIYYKDQNGYSKYLKVVTWD